MILDDLSDVQAALGAEDFPESQPPGSSPSLRRFSTWEITSHILPMAPNHLRRTLRAHPDWPQGSVAPDGRMRWFDLSEVQALRRAFADQGGARHLPPRPAGAPLIVTLAHPAPGMGKTTLAAHLAQGAALAGYRVLALDLCPSARLSQMLGAPDPVSALPLIGGQAAAHLREENRLRLSRGEPVLTPDQDLEDPLPAPGPTAWAGIDLMGGGLGLSAADQRIAVWQHLIRSWRPVPALRQGLAAAGHLTPGPGPAMMAETPRYDLIVIDTPAMLGPLSLSALAAADILLMPMVADGAGIRATARAMDQIRQALSAVEARDSAAARALGEVPAQFSWAALRVVLSRFEPRSQTRAATAAQARLGETLMMARSEAQEVLADPDGPGTIYGLEYRDMGRDRYGALRREADQLWLALQDLLVAVWQEKGSDQAEG